MIKATLLGMIAGALLAVILTGGAYLASGGPTDAPHCPTEDSCVIDYRDGAWHVREVTP